MAFIGGVVGSLFMDMAELEMAKFGIRSGVKAKYIGRWVLGVSAGVLKHRDIVKSQSIKKEVEIGLVFHFLVGGGVVALFYPVFISVFGLDDGHNHLITATIYGFLTCGLPWFILMPCFGWGLFGMRAPAKSKPVISPVIAHVFYGFGIGVTFFIFYSL
ncbi:MAG: DUF2938 family protein [Gammaproteobacteria bacterium]|nr:DUF2938 family protein [Gammaproteobacteria bacterium]